MRIAVNFRGRVQGVGFRFTAREVIEARTTTDRPLTGWVRNEPDGSVQMELQGHGPAVDSGLEAVRAAMGSKIAGFTRSEIPEVAGERGFVIAR